MTEETKVCCKCGKERPIKKFPIGKNLTRGSVCMICQYEREKERKERNDKFWLKDWIYGGV